MSIQHEVSELAGKTVDVLTDDAAGVRLTVARLGAEMVSLARRGADRRWTGFLYRDGDLSKNPDGWNNHATVMGYYIHRLKDEHSFYRGHEIRGGTHSFLRHKMFPAAGSGRVVVDLHHVAGRLRGTGLSVARGVETDVLAGGGRRAKGAIPVREPGAGVERARFLRAAPGVCGRFARRGAGAPAGGAVPPAPRAGEFPVGRHRGHRPPWRADAFRQGRAAGLVPAGTGQGGAQGVHPGRSGGGPDASNSTARKLLT